MALVLQGIGLTHLGKNIFENMDVSFTTGSLHILLGPADSGRSLLLRIIAGFTSPNYGKVLFNQMDITDLLEVPRGLAVVPNPPTIQSTTARSCSCS